jgi:hypothetical protein
MSYPGSRPNSKGQAKRISAGGLAGGLGGLIFYYRIINYPDFSRKQLMFKFEVKLLKQLFYVDG